MAILSLRYDNFPDHPDAPTHHRHTREEGVEGIDFDGIAPLYQRFKDEVSNHEHDWD